MQTLPSLPRLYTQIMKAVRSPEVSINSIGEIISQDVGMTARLLQLVNSAFFGLRQRVSSPSAAVTLLGLDTVKALVLTAEVFSQFDELSLWRTSLGHLWTHSLTVGRYARQIAQKENQERQLANEAFMAGLLHDCGKLVLAASDPKK
jgi:HD-like signal output (HDOD) protein